MNEKRESVAGAKIFSDQFSQHFATRKIEIASRKPGNYINALSANKLSSRPKKKRFLVKKRDDGGSSSKNTNRTTKSSVKE